MSLRRGLAALVCVVNIAASLARSFSSSESKRLLRAEDDTELPLLDESQHEGATAAVDAILDGETQGHGDDKRRSIQAMLAPDDEAIFKHLEEKLLRRQAGVQRRQSGLSHLALAEESRQQQQRHRGQSRIRSAGYSRALEALQACDVGQNAALPGSPSVTGLAVALASTFDTDVTDLGDRVLRVADDDATVKYCSSFLIAGDYSWCDILMPLANARAEQRYGRTCDAKTGGGAGLLQDRGEGAKNSNLRFANKGQYLGLSYGIKQSDPWSEMMSNIFSVKSQLFECNASASQGPMFTDMHKDNCDDLGCYSIAYETSRVCVDGGTTQVDGQKHEALSKHLAQRLPLSTFVKLDVEGDEWEVLESLLAGDQDIGRIRTLDLHAYMNEKVAPHTPVQRRVQLLEELSLHFAATGSTIQQVFRVANRKFLDGRKADSEFKMAVPFLYTSSGQVACRDVELSR